MGISFATQVEEINLAVAFATAAHGMQSDKAGVPYILHPLAVGAAVAAIAPGYGFTKEATHLGVLAGFLHDVIEDTPRTRGDVTRQFGEEVAEIVWALTQLHGEPPKTYIRRLAQTRIACVVKIADMGHNRSRLAEIDPNEAIYLEGKYAAQTAYLENILLGHSQESLKL